MTVFSKPSKVTLLISGACFALTVAIVYLLKKKSGNDDDDDYNFESYYKVQQVAEVDIPVEVVGSIIGRNGQNIDDIQRNTTTKIEFKIKSENGSDRRIAVIRGNTKNVEAAKQTLQAAVNEQLNENKFKANSIKEPVTLREITFASEAAAVVSSKNDRVTESPAERSIPQEVVKFADDNSTSKIVLLRESGESPPETHPKSLQPDVKLFQEAVQGSHSSGSTNHVTSEVAPTKDKTLPHKLQPEMPHVNKNPQLVENSLPSNTSKCAIEEIVVTSEVLHDDNSQTLASLVETENGTSETSSVNVKASGEQRRQKFQELVPTESDGFIDAYICYIDSPGRFWIQLASHPVANHLDKFLEDITSFYDDEHNNERFKVDEVKVGDVMATVYEDDLDWYRVRILSISGDKVNVKSLDFGGIYKVPISKLRTLTDDFLYRLPFQAIECRLAGVRPIGTEWSDGSTQVFNKLVHYDAWLKIHAKIIREEPNAEEGIKVVKLVDTTQPEDIYIADQLVNMGLALPD